MRQACKADVAFEGGWQTDIGLVAAVAFPEEKGLHWMSVATPSAGGIIAGPLAAGYPASH